MTDLLAPDEAPPALIINEMGTSPLVLICEHASNRLPKSMGTLGLKREDLDRHIAYDIGAEGVSRHLSNLLDCALVLNRYSRLAYDCNRSPEHAGAMPEVSEVFEIPGNKGLSPSEKLARVNGIYHPFHLAIGQLLDQRAVHKRRTIIVTMHSFTPVFKGIARTVEVGLLFDQDESLAKKLEHSFPGFDTRMNEPYSAKDGVMHTTAIHGAARGLPSLMLEIRNDLITKEDDQRAWGERLAAAFKGVT
jgi:predicted N-formylglutamate amidohydrolase